MEAVTKGKYQYWFYLIFPATLHLSELRVQWAFCGVRREINGNCLAWLFWGFFLWLQAELCYTMKTHPKISNKNPAILPETQQNGHSAAKRSPCLNSITKLHKIL